MVTIQDVKVTKIPKYATVIKRNFNKIYNCHNNLQWIEILIILLE